MLAYGVYFTDNGVALPDQKSNAYYVRAVRGGQSGSLATNFTGSGLWVFNTDFATWTKVTPADPENMIYSGTTLYADFGASGL